MDNWQRAGFGLYVHWPFCQAKCPYCDFNSHVVSAVDQTRWADALTTEIQRYGARLPDRRLDSIFFGGGTPSLMKPETVSRVIEAARRTWTTVNDLEITLEANPTSVEASRFSGYRDAGVNRVSIGVQSLRDTDLKALGRLHSAREALDAVEMAQAVFDRVSIDLIYARQDQSLADWKAELSEALALGTDHLSLYQLTIEPGTAFGARFDAGRLSGLPDEDVAADMYLLTQDTCAEAGRPGYEISNHARPGAESRHNLIYWRSGDWVGVGPGAHGRFTISGRRHATVAINAPGAWLNGVSEGSSEYGHESLSDSEVVSDAVMMGLRLSEGLDIFGPASALIEDKSNTIRELQELGFVQLTDGRLRVTDAGRPVLNAVLRALLD